MYIIRDGFCSKVVEGVVIRRGVRPGVGRVGRVGRFDRPLGGLKKLEKLEARQLARSNLTHAGSAGQGSNRQGISSPTIGVCLLRA